MDRLKVDPFRVLVFLLLIITVSRVHQHFAFLAAIQPAQLLVLGAVAYALAKPGSIRLKSAFDYWPMKLVAALGIVACVSAPFGLSLGSSASFIINEYAKILVVAGLFAVGIRGAKDLSLLISAYVLSCGILVVFALFIFDVQTSGGSYATRLSNLYTYDANDLGLVLLVGLPLAILMFQTSRGWKRWSAGLVVLGIGAAIARSGSRGAFVGLLAVGIALLLMLRHVSMAKRLGAVAVVGLGLLIATPPGYWQQMETLQEPTEDYNWTDPYGRRQIAERGIGYMVERPLTGVGINNFARAEATISQRARNFRYIERPGTRLAWVAPHNSYVQVGAELGVPGLVLWLGLLIGGVVGPYRLRRRLPQVWRYGDLEERFLYRGTLYLPVSMVAFAVTSSFVSFAYLDIVYLLAAFTAGLYVSVHRKIAHNAESYDRPLGEPETAGQSLSASA